MTTAQTKTLPLLMLRGMVVFPHMLTNLDIGRQKSLDAIREAMTEDEEVLLLTQKDANTENPTTEDVGEVGTIARIKKAVDMPNGHMSIVVEGIHRATVLSLEEMDEGRVTVIPFQEQPEDETVR
ncbi:MAG: LON peptidase substrate-binding domain-containing protein, partial [Bacilli bacterium]